MHQKLRKEDFGQNGLFLENLEIVERLKPFHINSNHLPIIWSDIFFSGEEARKTFLVKKFEKKNFSGEVARKNYIFLKVSVCPAAQKGPIHAKLNVLSNFMKHSLGLALFKSRSIPYFVVAALAGGRNYCGAAET